MHHGYTQAEGVANLGAVPATGCLVDIGFPKLRGGLGGYARYIAICPPGTARAPAISARRGAAAEARDAAALERRARLPRALSARPPGRRCGSRTSSRRV